MEMNTMNASKENRSKPHYAKYFFFGALIALIGFLGFTGYTNPELFRAAVTEVTPARPLASGVNLFIPDYESDEKDSGSIAVKVKGTGITQTENVVSLKFKLKYSPTNALTFNANSLIFDQNTLFKSADLKAVNTSVPGEILVSMFSNNGVTLNPNQADDTLFRLGVDINSTPGSEIKLSVENVEIIEKQAGGAFANSKQFKSIDAGVIKVKKATNANQLRIVSIESLSSTQLLVKYSDLLFTNTINNAPNPAIGLISDYVISASAGQAPKVTKVEAAFQAKDGAGNPICSTCDQSYVLLTTEAQTAGEIYILTVGTGNLKSNSQGGLDIAKNNINFFGYQAATGNTSGTQLTNIQPRSGSEVLLRFSNDIEAKSVTPVNFKINSRIIGGDLTISKAEATPNSREIILTTSQQVPNQEYFVIINGLKDSTGKQLVNNKLLSFRGYSAKKVAVSQVKPNSITNEAEKKVILVGQNLTEVTKVSANRVDLKFTNTTNGAMELTVPKDFQAGSYDLTLTTKDNTQVVVKGALTVIKPTLPFRIVTSESKSVPAKVAPDGKTQVTLYAMVEDPVDAANIDSVTIDLGPIGGSRAQAMQKDNGAQQKGRQFYTFTTTVDTKTPTLTTPYLLKVQARKGSQVVEGTVELTVTRDVLKSVAPVVDQIYINPTTVAPDGKTPVKISAKITDADGSKTIQSVVADLGSLGIGFVPLKPLGTGSGTGEQATAFYESAEFTVPKTTAKGRFKINVTASDDTGETGNGEITITVSESISTPKIEKDKTYIGPRRSVPNDNKTPFSISAMVSDADGVSDIDSVVAYFPTLGLKPVNLIRDPQSSDSAKAALYNSNDIVIPTTAPYGVQEIQIIATDKTGGTGSLNVKIDVTYEDTLGDTPIVFSDKSYASPRIAPNDGKTRVTLYAFVRDDDQDLESVIVNLNGIGQVGPETATEFGTPNSGPAIPASANPSGASCPTGSNTIVCMKPGFTEGRDGQWFVLNDVTISNRTAASNQPYEIEVIATDKARKVGRGKIPIIVRDRANFTQDNEAPQLIAAVPTSPTTIEVLFNEPILNSTISSSGKEFTITKKSNISEKLNVLGAAINTDGNLITLSTSNQKSGESYLITANSLQDLAGIKIGNLNRAEFMGFKTSRKSPVIQIVSATDQETIEVEFQESIRPSGIRLGKASSAKGDEFGITVLEAENRTNHLPIKSVQLENNGKTLVIKTNVMNSNTRYQILIDQVSTASGNTNKSQLFKFFKSVNYRQVQKSTSANQADLNGDGKVDFIDFTIFSASYGQVFGASGSAPTSPASTNPSSGNSSATASGSSQGLSPINPNPNSTIPSNSVPAGGSIR